MSYIGAKSIAPIMLSLLLFLTLLLQPVTGLSAEEEDHNLKIVDGRIDMLSSWIERLVVFPYDPVQKKRGEPPVAKIDNPIEPVELRLPPGDYQLGANTKCVDNLAPLFTFEIEKGGVTILNLRDLNWDRSLREAFYCFSS